ncbi:MAG: endolytic transglycosylase MltG [Desulfovibrionaceae bacterium]|nr:endolytic transglycosylase MltG [Desulfovibrionaceae bacterium]
MKIVVRIVAVLLLGVLLACFYVGYLGYTFWYEVPETEGRKLYFDVMPGQNVVQVAKALEKDHLVTNAKYFSWLARYFKLDSKLKAGRFELQTNLTPKQVLDHLVYGKPVLYRVTLPEGLTYWQTAKALADKGFVDLDSFLKVIKEPLFLRHYGIPFSSAEGFLMPDTYLLKRLEQLEGQGELEAKPEAKDPKPATLKEEAQASKETPTPNNPKDFLQNKSLNYRQAWSIAGRLVDNFWHKAQSLWPEHKRPEVAQLKTLVILASIVEKETALEAERPRVAGVYANRLQRNMLLQADPTVIYGLGPKFSGKLLYRHLDELKNPYNTYKHPGLPPGPICSFGSSALAAAIKPEKHQFLYFVAKGGGASHTFSIKLEDHNRAVEQYRRWNREHKNVKP